ncbi:MAG TPA: BON domain-containing protein [Verrucomicrobiae bacterium]|nr:BON domain-containing protein [Verrucomicrobiae bacterium]
MTNGMDKNHESHGKNHDLKDSVQSAIYKEMNDSGLGINVSARGNIISLWGMVDVLAEKVTAEKIARRVPGVENVDNGLTIAMDNFLPDKDINELVQARLSRSTHEIGKLGAQTHAGVVYLQGHATSLGLVHEAILIASQVKGVKEVVSEIKVGEGLDLDDASVTNAVERAFVNSDFVSARKVTTSTHKGVVKLQGMLDSLDDIEAAVQVAYRVPGVKAVHSELTARHGEDEGDRALTNELRSLISRQEDLSKGTIKAYVVNGIAFLSGEVFDVDAKRRAEELARQISGLAGISNTIQVSDHQFN